MKSIEQAVDSSAATIQENQPPRPADRRDRRHHRGHRRPDQPARPERRHRGRPGRRAGQGLCRRRERGPQAGREVGRRDQGDRRHHHHRPVERAARRRVDGLGHGEGPRWFVSGPSFGRGSGRTAGIGRDDTAPDGRTGRGQSGGGRRHGRPDDGDRAVSTVITANMERSERRHGHPRGAPGRRERRRHQRRERGLRPSGSRPPPRKSPSRRRT